MPAENFLWINKLFAVFKFGERVLVEKRIGQKRYLPPIRMNSIQFYDRRHTFDYTNLESLISRQSDCIHSSLHECFSVVDCIVPSSLLTDRCTYAVSPLIDKTFVEYI